jgi:hypothetical protein
MRLCPFVVKSAHFWDKKTQEIAFCHEIPMFPVRRVCAFMLVGLIFMLCLTLGIVGIRHTYIALFF